MCISEHTNFWVVQDAKGKIWKLNPEDNVQDLILETNAGKFNDIASSPINNCVVSAGADGFVRLWDYGNKRQFCARNFKTQSEATCIEWIPYNKRNSGRLLAVSFSDGIVRLVLINQNELTLIKA
jgi:WD40 repeat protein